jgi:hypothetical protein
MCRIDIVAPTTALEPSASTPSEIALRTAFFMTERIQMANPPAATVGEKQPQRCANGRLPARDGEVIK